MATAANALWGAGRASALPAGYGLHTTTAAPLTSGQTKQTTRSCPTGKKVVGGGVRLNSGQPKDRVIGSGPTSTGTGWSAQVGYSGTGSAK